MHELCTNNTINEIGNRIKQCRKAKGYTQIQIAQELNLSERQYSRFETGEISCNTKYLYEIISILDDSADYILFGKINVPQNISTLTSNLTPSELRKLYKIIEAFCS